MTLATRSIGALLFLTLALHVNAGAATPTQLSKLLKQTIATKFTVTQKGIGKIELSPTLKRVPPLRNSQGRVIPEKVQRFRPSKTIDNYFAPVPAAGFAVKGRIDKVNEKILSMTRVRLKQ